MKKMFLIATAMLLIVSCSEDDANNIGAGLNGSWTMTSYIGFIDELPIFEHGDVVYEFDLKNKTLTIENNIDETYPYLGDDGVYPISIGGNVITISHGAHNMSYKYKYHDGELVLEDGDQASDSATIHFERMIHNH